MMHSCVTKSIDSSDPVPYTLPLGTNITGQDYLGSLAIGQQTGGTRHPRQELIFKSRNLVPLSKTSLLEAAISTRTHSEFGELIDREILRAVR